MGWLCRRGWHWLALLLIVDLSIGSSAVIYWRLGYLDCIAIGNGIELRR
jgi:hypothetical protein